MSKCTECWNRRVVGTCHDWKKLHCFKCCVMIGGNPGNTWKPKAKKKAKV